MSMSIIASGLVTVIASNAVPSLTAVMILAAIAYIGVGLMRVPLFPPSATI